MQVFSDEVIFPDGRTGTYEYYKKNDIVVVVPMYQNRYVLIEQYRYLANTRMTEFPMGLLHEGEDVAKAGIRELQEETGLIADDVKYLGKCMLNKGVSSQVCHFVVARIIHATDKADHDNSESDIDVMYFESEEIKSMIKKGQIFEGPTMIGFMFSNLL